MEFLLTTEAFNNGQGIPQKYTCDGADVSPPLHWSGAPAQTNSLALIMDDPDAPSGTFDHWILFNLPASLSTLPEHVTAGSHLPEGAQQGRNHFGNLDYGGPCPPSGTHRYYFRLYALDTMLELKSGVSKKQLLAAMQGHILEQCALMGTYLRK